MSFSPFIVVLLLVSYPNFVGVTIMVANHSELDDEFCLVKCAIRVEILQTTLRFHTSHL